MKKLVYLFLITFALSVFAGNATFYVIAKSGLNLRAEANTTAKVLTTVAYGDAVTVTEPYVAAVAIDGMNGLWVKVKYKNMMGYLVNIYLIPNKLPNPGTKSIDDYFSQISTVAYKTEIIDNKIGGGGDIRDDYASLQKILYKNAMEIYKMGYYESSGSSYFFPNWSMENVFQLLKQISDFKVLNDYVIGYPSATKTYKKGERSVDVVVNNGRIVVSYEQDVYWTILIYQNNNQVVVEFSSGV